MLTLRYDKILMVFRACMVFIVIASMGSVMNMFNHVYFILSSILVLLLLTFDRFRVLRKAFLLLLVANVLLLSSLFTGTSLFMYRNFFINIFFICVLLVSYHGELNDLKNDIAKSCHIVCLLGIINFLLYLAVPNIFTHAVNDVGYKIETIAYLFNYSLQGESLIPRNQSLYWEPGVFQMVLNIYLYYLLIEAKKPLSTSVLPVFLIFTTQSTTGLLIMVIIFIYRLKGHQDKIRRSLKFFIVFFLIVISPIVFNNIQEKLFGDLSGSSQMRFYDYWMGLEIIKNYPLFGIGVDPDRYLNMNDAVDIPLFDTGVISVERGNTNSIISIGVCFGIPLMILFVVALYKQQIYSNKNAFFIVLLLGLISEPLYSSMLVMLFVFSSIGLKKNIIGIK